MSNTLQLIILQTCNQIGMQKIKRIKVIEVEMIFTCFKVLWFFSLVLVWFMGYLHCLPFGQEDPFGQARIQWWILVVFIGF